MHIALISFEYPPDTAFGGIATYAQQAGQMLAQRGHRVEVFAGSRQRSGSEQTAEGVWVHRIQVVQKADFMQAVVPAFAERHQRQRFEVVEGPDYGADAAAILQTFPALPFVLKLHTPRAIIADYEGDAPLLDQLRIRAGALRRGVAPWGDLERRHAHQADEVAAPSWALGKALMERWGLEVAKVHQYPLPFQPAAALVSMPAPPQTQQVTFVGRLDVKKGVTDLVAAIPQVLAVVPEARFRFIGRNGKAPNGEPDMQGFLQQQLGHWQKAVEFTGLVSPEQLIGYLQDTDVCVFPSRWESFGLVCLEAMAAARAVVGSSAGGMAELLDSPEYGRLVPPESPVAIATTLIELLQNPQLCQQLGCNARQRVLTEYSIDRIGELQEASYRRAIQVRQSQGPRSVARLL